MNICWYNESEGIAWACKCCGSTDVYDGFAFLEAPPLESNFGCNNCGSIGAKRKYIGKETKELDKLAGYHR